jgi:hypothetical protein
MFTQNDMLVIHTWAAVVIVVGIFALLTAAFLGMLKINKIRNEHFDDFVARHQRPALPPGHYRRAGGGVGQEQKLGPAAGTLSLKWEYGETLLRNKATILTKKIDVLTKLKELDRENEWAFIPIVGEQKCTFKMGSPTDLGLVKVDPVTLHKLLLKRYVEPDTSNTQPWLCFVYVFNLRAPGSGGWVLFEMQSRPIDNDNKPR